MFQRTLTACSALLLSLGGLSGCDPGPCVEEGLEVDKSYRVTFLEIYNEDSALALWDPSILASDPRECPVSLPPLASFDARVVSGDGRHFGGSCTSSELALGEASWGSIVDTRKGGPDDGFTSYQPLGFWAAEIEDDQGCRVWTHLHLVAPADGSPLAALNPAEAPPLLAIRSSNPENSEACSSYPETGCFERWIVRLEEIN